MDRARLLKHFEDLADSPDAVAKLRCLVLNLAVRGQLVSSSGKDEASAAWKQLIAEPCLDSPLFETPDQWHWTTLDRVAAPCGQKVPDSRFTYIDVGAIDNVRGVIKEDPAVLSADEAPSRARKLVEPQTVIFSTVRPYLRNIAIVDREFTPAPIVSTAFAVLHPKPFLEPRFLFHWLRCEPFQEVVSSKMKGMAYPAISDSEFWTCPIPVPPPAEQKRIVARVEELLALCDELEARQTAAREQRTRLVRSAFDHLTAAATPADFRRHADFALRHFPHLTATPDSIPALRQAILSLAVQGQLLPQNPGDETSKQVLARLKESRSRSEYCTVEAINSVTPVTDSEKPFELPPAWAWVRLGEIANIKHGFAFSSESFTSEKTPYVLMTPGSFFETGGFRDRGSKTKYYRGRVDPEYVFRPGDLVIPMTEQAAGLLGSPAFIPNDGQAYLHNQRLGKIEFYSELVDPRFTYWFFNSAFFRGELARTCTGMKVRHTSPKRVLSVPFPVCSLAEQQRIVAKVAALMRWCDLLEAQLAAEQSAAAALLDSSLRQLLNPAA